MLFPTPILVPRTTKTPMHIDVHPLTPRRFHLLSALKMSRCGSRCEDEIDTAPIFSHDSIHPLNLEDSTLIAISMTACWKTVILTSE